MTAPLIDFLIGLLFYVLVFYRVVSANKAFNLFILFCGPDYGGNRSLHRNCKVIKALVVAMMITVFIQIAGRVFSINLCDIYFPPKIVVHIRTGVPLFNAVTKLNNIIGSDEKVMITNRHLVYHLIKPYFVGHRYNQALVDFEKVLLTLENSYLS